MLYNYSYIFPFIDEAHNLSSIKESISDFQSPGLGLSPRKDNELNNNNHHYHHYIISYPSYCFFLITPNKPWLRKAFTLRMWLRPTRHSTPTLFAPIFSSRHPLPSFWPRNCPPPTLALRGPTTLPAYYLPMSHNNPNPSYTRPCIRMTPRRTRMSWIGT